MKFSFKSGHNQGFALPISIGVGLIMILIAITMVIRSNQSQIASISQRSSNNSLAAAETGVAQYLNLFNRFRNLAILDSDMWTDEAINEFSANVGCTAPDTSPGSLVRGAAVDVNGDPTLGSFELESYQYDEVRQRGTLVILGRSGSINSDPTPPNQGQTRLNIEFPVEFLEPESSVPNGGGSPSPAFSCLYPIINEEDVTNLVDSVAAESPAETPLPAIQMPAIQSDMVLPMPIGGGGGGGDDDDDDGGGGGATVPPMATYILGNNGSGNSIELNAGEKLRISQDTIVFLVMNGDMNLNGGSIQIDEDSRLFIVSSANINIDQGAATEPPIITPTFDSPKSWPLNIFQTSDGSELTINATATPPIPLAVFAPRGTVTLNNPSPTSSFSGRVWAADFAVTSGMYVNLASEYPPVPPVAPDFWEERLGVGEAIKQVNPITSWRKESLAP